MTIYDEPPAGGVRGGPHPLAGVPQHVLDAATKSLADAFRCEVPKEWIPEEETIEAIAHGVLCAAIEVSGAQHDGP